MKLFLLSIITIITILSNSSLAQVQKDYSIYEPKLNGSNIYRSTLNHYRIKIPTGWSINKPNSIGIEFNATDSLGIASMNIGITEVQSKSKLSVYDLPVDKMVGILEQAMPNSELIEAQKTYINNQASLLVKTLINLKTLNYNLEIISYQYLLIHDNKLFTLTYQINKDFEQEYFPIIEKSLLSFYFEDYLYENNLP